MNVNLMRMTPADRISELLGLPEEINDRASLECAVAKGLPASSVDNILNVMHAVPNLNLIAERALRRAKAEKQPLSPAKSRTLYDLARAYVVADKFYSGNGILVMRFLEKPNPDLGGATPLSMAITSPAGADAVIGVLEG
ncbi:putative toxin-antitoxin system antitoxin component, TIGR02293 family [Loktanella salsilacus]|uniref:Putative toxin-antitoxin system antitoxin component, TIGR02293 family n=2 Tax=Loktanella salsilacus TaxID=195913 RepID=A0A1I4HWL1_9RHOB|nr:putative toxin-antitoxin system antitoxin component, TIGR02293 family [Loktanella salsilacus]